MTLSFLFDPTFFFKFFKNQNHQKLKVFKIYFGDKTKVAKVP
jgi:hypothetical protein